jgi:acetyl-CoA synthetase
MTAEQDSESTSTDVRGAVTRSVATDPSHWWLQQSKRVTWVTQPTKSFQGRTSVDDWFGDGTLNGSFSCTDIHVIEERRERVAFHWFGDRANDTRTITYFELHVMINHATNALIELGVKPFDRVAVCSPCIPEAITAMLAITRLGATHVVINADAAAESIATQLNDAGCSLVVVADGSYRADVVRPLKSVIDDALKECPSVRSVVVVRRTGKPVQWVEGRDHWWHDTVDPQSDSHWCDPFPSDQPFFVLNSESDSVSPQITRTTGGYLTQAATAYATLMRVPFDDTVMWTAAELDELAGHSYIVYGPLINGATQLLFEGRPDSWAGARWTDTIGQYDAKIVYADGSTIFGTN